MFNYFVHKQTERERERDAKLCFNLNVRLYTRGLTRFNNRLGRPSQQAQLLFQTVISEFVQAPHHSHNADIY